MKTHSICFIILLAANSILANTPLHVDQSKPNIRIIDGDTIVVNGTRHRLSGVDAPERRQLCQRPNGARWACGKAATQALRDFVKNKAVTCRSTRKDRYHRALSTCFAGQININVWLVRNGWALAYRRYSKKYVNEEKLARSDRAGIWSGKFISPWRWRQEQRLKILEITSMRKGARNGP